MKRDEAIKRITYLLVRGGGTAYIRSGEFDFPKFRRFRRGRTVRVCHWRPECVPSGRAKNYLDQLLACVVPHWEPYKTYSFKKFDSYLGWILTPEVISDNPLDIFTPEELAAYLALGKKATKLNQAWMCELARMK